MADGLVSLQYHNSEQNIKTNMLIIFVAVNIVVKKILTIGMICGKNIIVVDYRMKRRKKSMNKKTSWKLPLIIVAGVIAVILLCVFGVQSSQNRAFALEEQVNTAQSDIKVQEKRRVDLVYNLADCVKQYDKHESETLTAIAEGRGSAGDIENVTTAITAVSEAYPELKSNENYKQLMNELAMTENLIAEYRSNYNKQVKEYNRYVRKFPTRMFLNMLGYEVQDYTYLDYSAPETAPQNLFGE